MRFNPHPNEQALSGSWEELGVGAPTLVALAKLCSHALAESLGVSASGSDGESRGEAATEQNPPNLESLSIEARAILYAARDRGIIEVKGVNTAFESADRLLAVHVEREPECGLVFRSRGHPEFTIRCLDGFRQLCRAGYILHHLYREFSLSQKGFEVARRIAAADVQSILDQVTEYG